MTCAPMSFVAISRSSVSWRRVSTSSTIASSCAGATGRFSQAFTRPARSFFRSKFSRRPSFLTTMYGISSIVSYEVKRRLQDSHSLRRRITSPSRLSRESTTRSSTAPQKGHFMPPLWRDRRRVLTHARKFLELVDSHRGRREERDPDESDRDERDRVCEDRDSGRRIPSDPVHVGQRELNSQVIGAETSGGRKHETEHGRRGHDEARREGEVEVERAQHRVDLHVDDQPPHERAGSDEEEEFRALERREAVHEGFRERARPRLEPLRQPAPELLEKPFRCRAPKHGKEDRCHEREEKRGRDQEEEDHRGAVEDALQENRGEQRRERELAGSCEKSRPENLSDFSGQVVRGEAERSRNERG